MLWCQIFEADLKRTHYGRTTPIPYWLEQIYLIHASLSSASKDSVPPGWKEDNKTIKSPSLQKTYHKVANVEDLLATFLRSGDLHAAAWF